MAESQLMQFTSQVAGKHVDVEILTSRLQWTVRGHRQVVRMLPLWAISSVETSRALAGKSKLTVSLTAGVIEFKVGKAIAEQAKTMLTQLVTQREPLELDDTAGGWTWQHRRRIGQLGVASRHRNPDCHRVRQTEKPIAQVL